jgi:hypothetical protein
LTEGLDEQHAVMLTDLNWQLENGLDYLAKETRGNLAHEHLPRVLVYAPALIRDNLEIGRRILLTHRAAAELNAAYGPLFQVQLDRRSAPRPLADITRALPIGTAYVLCVLGDDPDFAVNQDDLRSAVNALTGGAIPALPVADYTALVGTVGAAPLRVWSESQPFRRSVRLGGAQVQVRMESWLRFDTIRRMGFGHVIANRRHALIVERGVSFVTLGADGRALQVAYRGGLYQPQPRYLIPEP